MYIVFSPDIIIHPTDTSAAAPFSGVFTCSAKGCSSLNVIWHRQNNSLPKAAYHTQVTSANKTTSTLTIPNISGKDVGKYYCVVWAGIKATQSYVANLFLAGEVYSHACFCYSVYVGIILQINHHYH